MLKIVKLLLVIALVPMAKAATTDPSPPFTISPQTTVILGPLRADGSVDYVAALNQRNSQGVTPENNGFVLWLHAVGNNSLLDSTKARVLAMCGAEDLKGTDLQWASYPKDMPVEQAYRLWKAEQNPDFVKYLQNHEEGLALVAQAVEKPQWWTPSVSINGGMTGILLPELNAMRPIASTFCSRALLRAQQGDFDGFLSDAMTTKRLACRTQGIFLVSDLVAYGMNVVADRTIGAAAGAGVFSRGQCAALAKSLDDLAPLPHPWESIDIAERWSTLEWAEAIATGNFQLLNEGNGDKDHWQNVFNAVDRNAVDWNAVLLQINADYDQIVQTTKLPSPRDRQNAERDFDRKFARLRTIHPTRARLIKEPSETNQAYTQRVTDAILSILLPTVWRPVHTFHSSMMEGEMARAVVAAAEYHADKGKWPDKLEDLMPDYLPELPRDVFAMDSTRLVRYQKTAKGICLHARGLLGNDIAVGAQ